MIRIAAVGDLHYDSHSAGRLSRYLSMIDRHADLFLIAGDLTQVGSIEEARCLADDLSEVKIPIFAVFGNHDYHSNLQKNLVDVFSQARISILEGNGATLNVRGTKVGIVGLKGFGGGFVGACGSDFGEHEMKSFVRTTKDCADVLKSQLQNLDCEIRIALTHYSPIEGTLLGEKKEIYPFLGSYLLAEAIDQGRADIAIHGHAHHGIEKGMTPGGIPVRNVALPVITSAYNIYTLLKDQFNSQFSSLPDSIRTTALN